MYSILLCIDSYSVTKLRIADLDLLKLFEGVDVHAVSSAEECRAFAKTFDLSGQAWVCPVDDMDAINLAATIKADNPELTVKIFMPALTGSDKSRANAAGIESVQLFADMRACVTDYVGKTVQNRFDQSGEGLHEIMRDGDADLGPKAFVMSVLSGNGGVGKSAFSALASWRLAFKGYKTLLIDCDLQFGDAHNLSNGAVVADISDVITDAVSLRELCAGAFRERKPVLLRAPSRLELSEEIGRAVSGVLEKAAAVFDVVLANTGSNWMDYHAQLLDDSSASLFLMDQRASSVKSCQHAVALCQRMGVATRSFVYALNKCEKASRFSSLDASCALDGVKVYELLDGGAEVEELLGSGRADVLASSSNAFVESIDKLMVEIVPPLGASGGAGDAAFDERGWGVSAGLGGSAKKSGRRRTGRHIRGMSGDVGGAPSRKRGKAAVTDEFM